jgi:XTP/dITP diphosphohydrolase
LTNRDPLPTITPLVIATRNRGKYKEILALLKGLRVSLVPLDRAGPVEVPPEGGDSFQENARRKAAAVAAATGCLALADDSGLVVDALGGEPGVHSARFGGPSLRDDAQRNQLLLARLRGIPAERRTARFCCAVAIGEPGGRLWETEGTCEGRIVGAPRGENGFGYDPIFEVPALGRTLAELDLEAKNRVSHRAQALGRARAILEGLLRGA